MEQIMIKKLGQDLPRDFKSNRVTYWNNLSRLTNMLIKGIRNGLRHGDLTQTLIKREYFMPTPSNAKIQSMQHCGHLLWEYSFYVRQALRNPVIYLTSALIGLLTIWMMNAPSIILFIVPFIVQIAANSILRFRNKNLETLLLLPGQREDPVFIMDLDGNVVLSAGKTEQLLKKISITNITDLIGADEFDRLINQLDHSCIDPETRSIDIYFERLENWYEIKFKASVSRCGRLPEKFDKKYMFDERVRSFLNRPIRNFINYHAGDVSIIAFISVRTITVQENIFIEVLLNTTRAIVSLADLARENDEQFLQKVMGLCAAAEYSDEITGRHTLRVNAYSRLIAGELGFDSDFVDNIGRVAALHDIGKVAIPELIKLAKSYSRDQRLEMQMHTIYCLKNIISVSRRCLKACKIRKACQNAPLT
jgi:hypothetical protein